jgi:hypothetical protein
VVVEAEIKEHDEQRHSPEGAEKCAQKGFDRADIVIALGKAWKRRNRR